MRFLADMGVSMGVVDWLRERDHDVVHLRDENLHRMPDGDIFDKAAAEDRTVLTFDLDFGEIVAFSRGRVASVVIFRLRDTRTPSVIVRLDHVLAVSGADLVRGAVVVVEDGQHRVRQLPPGA